MARGLCGVARPIASVQLKRVTLHSPPPASLSCLNPLSCGQCFRTRLPHRTRGHEMTVLIRCHAANRPEPTHIENYNRMAVSIRCHAANRPERSAKPKAQRNRFNPPSCGQSPRTFEHRMLIAGQKSFNPLSCGQSPRTYPVELANNKKKILDPSQAAVHPETPTTNKPRI